MYARTRSLGWLSLSLFSNSSRHSVGSFTPIANKPRRFFSSTSASATASDCLRGKTVVPIADAISFHSSPNVKFVDGSWFLHDRCGREEFQEGPRIQDAMFFDIDDIATASQFPHMMPKKELFAAAMDAMGIEDDDHIIVYGSQDCPFFHRAWFQIRNMGHGDEHCHILDGSLADWSAQGGPTEEKGTTPSNPIISANDLDLTKPAKYQRATDPQNVVNKEELKAVVAQGDSSDAVIVDVRALLRYQGSIEEPRPGMRLGHMPGAKNVFFADLLTSNVSKFKPKEELAKIIANGGVDINTDKRIIVHCGSGASACTLVAAMELCGRSPRDNYIYDGSWSEWGLVHDTPVERDGKLVD